MENIGEREPQPYLPLLRVMPCIRRCSTPFLGSVKGGEDLPGILVFFVEVLCLLDPHADHDAPFGLRYVLPRAKTSLDRSPTGYSMAMQRRSRRRTSAIARHPRTGW